MVTPLHLTEGVDSLVVPFFLRDRSRDSGLLLILSPSGPYDSRRMSRRNLMLVLFYVPLGGLGGPNLTLPDLQDCYDLCIISPPSSGQEMEDKLIQPYLLPSFVPGGPYRVTSRHLYLRTEGTI